MIVEVKLPSGAILKVQPAPFEPAKALYQAVLEEFRGVPFDSTTDMAGLFKNLACVGFSSKKIEAALAKCMERCTYSDASGSADLKIDKDTFEPVERRQDYIDVCMAVARENIAPFVKGLYAEFEKFLLTTEKSQP